MASAEGGRPRGPVACGHGNAVRVSHDSGGMCWDCHIATLRARGECDRADRLVELKRQHDEGRFDIDRLEAGMAGALLAEYSQHPQEQDERGPRAARPMRHGEGMPS